MDLMGSIHVLGIYSVKLNMLVLGRGGMSLNPSGLEMGLKLLHRLSIYSFVSVFQIFSCFKLIIIIIISKSENITLD